jgi:polyferredoxin
MSQVYKSMSIANPDPVALDGSQKLFATIGSLGLLILIVASFGINLPNSGLWLVLSLSLMAVGVIGFSYQTFRTQAPGIKNNGIWFSSAMSRGIVGWTMGILITGFYILLYWYPSLLGLGKDGALNTGLVGFFDPLSMALKGKPASEWFVYGTLYTLAIIIFGVRFIWKYRHNKYQILRTCSVMFFQLGFAFLIPEFMQKLNYPYNDMKNMWPLNYYFFDEWNVKGFLSSGNVGLMMLILGVAMIFFISPILTYLYGKRWYCSWVCGCGGLAETAGDPFRHLSDKSIKAWQIERWSIHLVLVFSFIMTVGVIFSFFHNNPSGYWLNKTSFMIIMALILIALIVAFVSPKLFKNALDQKAVKIFMGIAGASLIIVAINFFTGSGNAFFVDFYALRSSYGFLIGAAFSGVVGVGFYPLMGSRVWCRFGCPMAGLLGIQQKMFSRFRITTNGSQCISCGNCSTYCEMGIDVRSYAQKGQDIVRASCVGCGVCAAVCPRGVLKLENGSEDLYEKAIDIRNNHVGLIE